MPAPKGHPPYAGCETGGSPKIHTKEFIENEADEFEKWMLKKDSIWFKDFCFDRRLDPDLMSKWAKENEKFAGTYKRALLRQESLLVRGGLSKKFQYNMCALLMGHLFGIVAKQETKITGDPLGNVLDSVDGNSRDLVSNDKEE